MVVEDEVIIALDVKNRLESIGYFICTIVSSGEEALRIINEQKPDLVLMDIVLKGDMDGMQAAEIITKDYNIPVVFLTSYSDDKTVELARKISPFGILVKPFNENDLKQKLELVKEL
jgi:CheY-like chemotaxis protein